MLACASVMLFSDIGYGEGVWEELASRKSLSENCGRGAMALMLFLYIFDFSYWTGFLSYFRGLLVGIILLFICSGCVLVAADYPYAPMSVYIGIQAPWFMLLKRGLYPHTPLANYVQSVSVGLLVSGFVCIGVWVTWIFLEDKWWQGETRMHLREKMGCLAAKALADQQLGTEKDSSIEPPECLAAYLLWFSPCMMGIAFALFGCVAGLLASSLKKHSSRFVKMRVFIGLVGVLIMGMYIAASIAGAGSGIAGLVWSFSAGCLILLCGMFYASIGFQRAKALFNGAIGGVVVGDPWWLDWAKAFFLWVFTPVLFLYLLLSMVNQFVRNTFMGCTSWSRDLAKQRSEQRYKWLTGTTSAQMTRIADWRWTSVLIKIILWGLIFILFNVGVAKVVVVFMSWLNGKLVALSIPTCVGVFVAVGITMFLLPPVPGVPVYLTGGVMLPFRMQTEYGFWWATFYTTVICFIIKLAACSIQQKLFGERMSQYVSVRSFCGVNSVSIRAIKLILQQKCLTVPKVSILCGGPDWPTSVLAGILRLPLREMMLGTIPIYFLIVPTVLAGAFMIKEGELWGAISNIAAAGAGLVQGLALVLAGYYVEMTASSPEGRKKIDAMPLDREVQQIEERNTMCTEMYRDYTSWSGLLLPDDYAGDRVNVAPMPRMVKLVLLFGAFLTITYSWVFQFFPCFEAFEVNMSIYDAPLYGDPLALVKPLGWRALYMFGMSLVCIFLFDRWALCRRNAYLPRKKARLLEILSETGGSYGGGDSDGTDCNNPDTRWGDSDGDTSALAGGSGGDGDLQSIDLGALKAEVLRAQTKNDVLRGMVARLGEGKPTGKVSPTKRTANGRANGSARESGVPSEKEVEDQIWQANIERADENFVQEAAMEELDEDSEEELGKYAGGGSGYGKAGGQSMGMESGGGSGGMMMQLQKSRDEKARGEQGGISSPEQEYLHSSMVGGDEDDDYAEEEGDEEYVQPKGSRGGQPTMTAAPPVSPHAKDGPSTAAGAAASATVFVGGRHANGQGNAVNIDALGNAVDIDALGRVVGSGKGNVSKGKGSRQVEKVTL
jgi:hypothetical protein